MKRLVLVILSIFIFNNIANAQDKNADNNLLIRLKTHRTDIYSQLTFTPEQVQKLQSLDTDLYTKINPEFEHITDLVNKIQEIANSNNCTKQKINTIKKEFKTVDKNIEVIKKDYEKEFRTIVTNKQYKEYKQLKRQKYLALKKEMQAVKSKQQNK